MESSEGQNVLGPGMVESTDNVLVRGMAESTDQLHMMASMDQLHVVASIHVARSHALQTLLECVFCEPSEHLPPVACLCCGEREWNGVSVHREEGRGKE